MTLTLARLYEDQGHKIDALEIYEELLKKDPENIEIVDAISRLSGKKKNF
jgi:tetratricopeptide (TPR) repeat protein